MKSDRDGFVQQINGADPKGRAAHFDVIRLGKNIVVKIIMFYIKEKYKQLCLYC